MSLLKTLALSLAVLTLSFVGTVVLHQALAFNNPSAPPPAGNVPLPLNTSPTTQTKQGPLGATQFQDTNNTLYFFKPSGTSKLGGTLNLSGNRIKNVQDPEDAQDAATKAYVDAIASSTISCQVINEEDFHTFPSNWCDSKVILKEPWHKGRTWQWPLCGGSNADHTALKFCQEAGYTDLVTFILSPNPAGKICSTFSISGWWTSLNDNTIGLLGCR